MKRRKPTDIADVFLDTCRESAMRKRIAERAYFFALAGHGANDDARWLMAERIERGLAGRKPLLARLEALAGRRTAAAVPAV